MRVLKIIHGYPPRYNAGSEVYSQTLCGALRARCDVHVFTREENPFAEDGVVRRAEDSLFPGVKLHIVNAARVGINYDSAGINRAFARAAREIAPDVAHIGHLNHLSLGIADELAALEIPIVFTLHDFWLMCMRGQFIQTASSENGGVWPLCSGQDDKKCADNCLRKWGGENSGGAVSWTDWTGKRMAAARRAAELTDIFIAPSKSLGERFCADFPQTAGKIEYLDYGFDRRRLSGRRRDRSEKFIFGYIGTHIPGKGVHDLLDAFGKMAGACGHCELHVWGRATVNTEYLKMMAAEMPASIRARIRWRGEYANSDIVGEVFNHVDSVVVPSIWAENSPLVIHEAQQARVPVIAANMGGMAEYVKHEENGLLFEPRNAAALSAQMERLARNPEWAETMGRRGYWYDKNGDVPDITAHALEVEDIYRRAVRLKDAAKIGAASAPWRITFDTNPDHCNYHCTMCEEHSPYSPLQFRRRAAGAAKRVMPFDVIARSVKVMAAKGLREIIPSTMGEPLLYKDFVKIVKLCEETGVLLNLTTNGSFPRLGAEKWAELLVPVSSDIKISWNGACKKTQEAVMKNANWDEMLANVAALAAARDRHAAAGGNRCRLTFQMTFMETNSGELPDIVRLAASLGIDRVKGHHLWAHFSEIKNEDMRRGENSICRWNDIVAAARHAADECRLPSGGRVLLENIEFLNPNSPENFPGQCPFLGKEAWISAEGRFNPCCAPDAERRTLGEFGNLHEKNLPDIWNGKEYQILVKSYRSRAVCRKCNMRKAA